eukprot:348680-Prorocentrum_minimum.AAC.3
MMYYSTIGITLFVIEIETAFTLHSTREVGSSGVFGLTFAVEGAYWMPTAAATRCARAIAACRGVPGGDSKGLPGGGSKAGKALTG